MVDVPTAPALATVAGVELGSVGYWDISNIKDWHPTAEDFAQAIAALDCPAIRRPVLKFGHTAPAGEGDPTLGHVDNMRLTEDGQTLVGDFVGLPAWLAAADSEGRSVLSSAYPDRSGEWFFDHQCSLGHTHPFVLRAVALLGIWEPGIATLESLYDLYTKAPEKETAMAKAASVALAGTTADQVRKAYYEAEPDWYLWIREMYVDPPELIVQNDKDDSLVRVPYTVSGDGEVEFSEGQAVKVEYVAARTQLNKPAVAFTSRTEARPAVAGAPDTPPPVEVEETKEKEITVANLSEAALRKLGLDADADLDAVNAALEALSDGEGAEQQSGELETPAQVAAAAAKLGMVIRDADKDTQLHADAAAGREALSRINRDSDQTVVRTAISEGKIPPSREAHYVSLMERDREGTTAWLASVPKEAAVALTEMGHAAPDVVDSKTGENNPLLKELI